MTGERAAVSEYVRKGYIIGDGVTQSGPDRTHLAKFHTGLGKELYRLVSK